MNEQAHTWHAALNRARRAWCGSVLPDFFVWWGRELVACVPRQWVARWQDSSQWCQVTLDDDDVALRRAGTDGLPTLIDIRQPLAVQQSIVRDAVAAIDPQDLRFVLCLKPDQVLRRQLTLPFAARGELARVLGYEMDRQTPFRSDQVAYAWRVVSRVSAVQMQVELVAMPSSSLTAMLARFTALGIHVDAVDALEGAGRMGVNMIAPAARPKHVHPRRRLNLALAAIAVLLAVLGMSQWLHNRRMTLAAMQAQVDVLRNQARQVAELRRRLAERTSAAGFLQRQRVRSPAVIDVLDDLTRRLPNDTWLDHFTLNAAGRVDLQGESLHATQVLKSVDASPYLDNPGFQGVIQTDARTGKERFYMTATVRAAVKAGQPAHATTSARGS